MIISFSYTTPALLAGAKTVTRREWKYNHARRFNEIKAHDEIIQAWDKSPRFGGQHIADIQLTEDLRWASIFSMPASDYQAEGFEWLCNHRDTVDTKKFGRFAWDDFQTWRDSRRGYWVVRFKLVNIRESLGHWLERRQREKGSETGHAG